MPVTGYLAAFDGADALVSAAGRAGAAGLTRVEAYSPYPLPEAAEALGYRYSGVPLVILLGGLVGGTAGYLMQYWINAVDYPLNVGGRPHNSWPAFVPVVFELTVLTAASCGLIGLLALCGLPRYHHPVFAARAFARASTDGFLLWIDARDPRFDPVATRDLLGNLGATEIEEVTA